MAPGAGELVLTLRHVAAGWFWDSPIRTRVVLRLCQPAAHAPPPHAAGGHAPPHPPCDRVYEDLMAKAVEAALHKALQA